MFINFVVVVASYQMAVDSYVTQIHSSRKSLYCTSRVSLIHLLWQESHFALHKLESGPSLETELTRDDCLHFYREMTLSREMELVARDLYQQKIIRGFLHVYVGQVRRVCL